MSKLRTAVIGAGKMGSIHSRIYSQMDQVELVAIVDGQLDKATALSEKFGTKAYSDPAEILDLVDAVTVAVPTEHHAAVAKPFLARGIGVLVEKPLASTLKDAKEMLSLANEKGAILQVGYSERFNPVVQAMRRLDFTPRYMESQRVSPYTFRSTDVGVVLDMMIHDIDIMLSLVCSDVVDVQAVGVHVLGEHEDVANVRVVFASGCVANLTASRMAMSTDRKIRVFSEKAYLSLDCLNKQGVMINTDANINMMQWVREQQAKHGEVELQKMDWTELLKVEMLDMDDSEPLRLEQDDFIKSIQEKTRPQVSGEDAIAAMELAERIVKAIQAHRWEGNSSKDITKKSYSNTN